MRETIEGLGECPICHKLEEWYWPSLGGMPRVGQHNNRSGEKCTGAYQLAVNPVHSDTGKRVTKAPGGR